jgi:hypothetical protein
LIVFDNLKNDFGGDAGPPVVNKALLQDTLLSLSQANVCHDRQYVGRDVGGEELLIAVTKELKGPGSTLIVCDAVLFQIKQV